MLLILTGKLDLHHIILMALMYLILLSSCPWTYKSTWLVALTETMTFRLFIVLTWPCLSMSLWYSMFILNPDRGLNLSLFYQSVIARPSWKNCENKLIDSPVSSLLQGFYATIYNGAFKFFSFHT